MELRQVKQRVKKYETMLDFYAWVDENDDPDKAISGYIPDSNEDLLYWKEQEEPEEVLRFT